MNGLNTSKQDDGAREFFKTYRKLRAIDRIKAQPFYRPRDDFYDGLQWTPAQIDRLCGRADGRRTVVWDLSAEMTEANRIIKERMNG